MAPLTSWSQTPWGPAEHRGGGSFESRGTGPDTGWGHAPRETLSQNLSTDIFVLEKNDISVSEDQVKLTHFYLPVHCELFQNLGVSFQQVRARKGEVFFHVVGSWGTCPVLSFQSRSSVLCYCFKFRRILLFGYNCDSFLT